ncbi:MAG: alginate lyase family protein [Rhodospirillaceae bacterium]|nr:alginate lyase family protein [Rhodospirillaceae bacterium]
MGIWLQRALRAVHRPSGEIMRRLVQEAVAWPDRYRAPPAAKLTGAVFARLFGAPDIDALWQQLAARPFPAITKPSDGTQMAERHKSEAERVAAAASRIMNGEIDIFGHKRGDKTLPPDWSLDFVSGHRWPAGYFRDLDLNALSEASDVKLPWELSRMQWLIPVGQHYVTSGDERCAEFAGRMIADWIAGNPYGRGVNWGIAMEAAMRIITWSWLFHVFAGAKSWEDGGFRETFLKSLYAHAVFCDRYTEDYGAGGNHLIADATALQFAGSLFASEGPAKAWAKRGWDILCRQISRQVGEDGVDFEGSTAYHRFVAELFAWAARVRSADGGEIPPAFAACLKLMAEFTTAYSRRDGRAPLWGDNDNGRALPFGGQHLNDHSYIPALIAASLSGDNAPASSPDAATELIWSLGANHTPGDEPTPASRAFAKSGVYVMQAGDDHIFVDCAPVGSDGRGGHGHNDCLSFEATLQGVSLLTDSGSYVYTGSKEWRNQFRGSGAHNAPMIDDQEANRFVGQRELFLLHADAVPEVRHWSIGENADRLTGAHSGYERLQNPVRPVRTIILDKAIHGLAVRDEFEGRGVHKISIALHFGSGIALTVLSENIWRLSSASAEFHLIVHSRDAWTQEPGKSWISESYGAKSERACLHLNWQGALSKIDIGIYPAISAPDDPFAWLEDILEI